MDFHVVCVCVNDCCCNAGGILVLGKAKELSMNYDRPKTPV